MKECPDRTPVSVPRTEMAVGAGQVEDGTELMSNSGFVRWLRRRVDERVPTAVVRLLDGEGRLLFAHSDDAESMRVATRKLEKETGLSLPAEVVLEVRALVAFAFDEADVLGIRFIDEFSDTSKMWARRLAALYAERRAAGRPPAALAYCQVNGYVLDTLPQMLAGRRVSVISCRDLKPVLERDWGIEDVAVYQVPSQHMVRDVDGAYERVLHEVPIYPDVHIRLRSELAVREPGEVFLVGAGVFGKDLCVRVRERGGIALDMGSVLDQLAGKVTRGPARRARDLYASGMSVQDIADDFRRLYGEEVDREVITDAIAPLVARRE
jgi:hypothetical protein